MTMRLPRIPSSTYRLQFNKDFTFRQAAAIVDYLHDLGVSDVYASPILRARPGSVHGYDVIDHSTLNPEIGTEEDFREFAGRLRERGMGLIADVVPNHMCVDKAYNAWWMDVLENGPSSPHARFFDIDWNPPKEELRDKVLLPVLGDQYGRVLESQEIRLAYSNGAFDAHYYGSCFPIAPRTWRLILRQVVDELKPELGESHEQIAELESIITALEHLPRRIERDEEKVKERQREKEVNRRRILAIVNGSEPVRLAIARVLDRINGRKGDPHSFDRLEELLDREAYRLSFWRVAADEINYRRFFDVNELAAIRVEDPEVFREVHALLLRFVREGLITGFRVDHPDGLFDPDKYFCELQRAASDTEAGVDCGKPERPFYIVAEKILVDDERMRSSWDISGTVGYEFLNLLNGLYVDATRKRAFLQLYSRVTGWSGAYEDVAYSSKRLILAVSMSSELNVLGRWLNRVSEYHRYSRDFTHESLRHALREIVACFPVYRTYTRLDQAEVSAEDRGYIDKAVAAARRRNPAVNASVFEFIRDLLLLRQPEGLTEQQVEDRRMFVMKFQQITGPVMAKGVEDTAFYRYYPLASLNEVGGDPERFGVPISQFHRRNAARLHAWPHSMLATSTHDVKRGEDVRARVNVLSEMPAEWYRAVTRWQRMNRQHATDLEGKLAPDANDAYLLYQTLVGTWPLEPMTREQQPRYVERIQTYMNKAIHEAKVHSSWVNPNQEYDDAMRRFIEAILRDSPDNPFLDDFREFQTQVARSGCWNSLSQTLLKIASPGVPDFYQGTEMWAFTLVDPDNRGAVDYDLRRAMLEALAREGADDRASLVRRLTRNLADGSAKLYVTSRALALRNERSRLFSEGVYVSLLVTGERADDVVAFARVLDDEIAIAVAGRFFLDVAREGGAPAGRTVWGDTRIVLPRRITAARFRDALTDRMVEAEGDEKRSIPVADAFAVWPLALLQSAE